VFLDPLANKAPPLHSVTFFAIRTHLPAVDIGVTVGAVRPCIGEDRLGVALRTGDTLVEAAERIASCIVIEFGDGANGFPSDRGMAVLARDAQVAMGASRNRAT
jgi:hypothetical protein